MSQFERDFDLSRQARFHTVRDAQMPTGLPNHLSARRERGDPSSLNFAEVLVSKEERERLSRHIITTYAGIDDYLLQNSDGREFIGDMWLVPKPTGVEPVPPDAAVKKLRSLSRKIDNIGLERLPQEWVWGQANLEALATYLEERSKTNGQMMPYEEYLRKVSGFRPQLIPRDVQEADRAEVLFLLSRLGYKFDENHDATIRAALQLYLSANRIPTRGLVELNFKRFDLRYRNQVGEMLGRTDLSLISFDFRWREEDAFWRMWERVETDGYHLDANWHPRQRKSFTYGATEGYAVHEPAHFEMAYSLSQEIKTGNLDPVAGIFTIPGPGCYVLEGIAQTMPELAGLELTDDGKLFLALYRSWVRTRTNGLYKLEMGVPMEEVILESRHFALDKTTSEMEADYRDGLSKPFDRAYLPVYGLSDYDLLIAKKRLGGAMDILLRDSFRRPMLREDIIRPTLDMEPLMGYDLPAD